MVVSSLIYLNFFVFAGWAYGDSLHANVDTSKEVEWVYLKKNCNLCTLSITITYFWKSEKKEKGLLFYVLFYFIYQLSIMQL